MAGFAHNGLTRYKRTGWRIYSRHSQETAKGIEGSFDNAVIADNEIVKFDYDAGNTLYTQMTTA